MIKFYLIPQIDPRFEIITGLSYKRIQATTFINEYFVMVQIRFSQGILINSE